MSVRKRANETQEEFEARKLALLAESVAPPIDVSPPDAKEPLTVTEKIQEAVKRRSPSKSRGRKIDDNILKKVAPLLVATFVATYSRDLIDAPYKECAPSQQEVIAIVSPLFNILSRSLTIAGKMDDTTIDLIFCALASLMYGSRVYMTYSKIKEKEEHARLHGNVGTSSPTTGTDRSQGGGEVRRESYPSNGGSEQVGPLPSNGSVSIDTGDSEDARREAALFADLFSKDIDGRVRLGMLPPRVSTDNQQ